MIDKNSHLETPDQVQEDYEKYCKIIQEQEPDFEYYLANNNNANFMRFGINQAIDRYKRGEISIDELAGNLLYTVDNLFVFSKLQLVLAGKLLQARRGNEPVPEDKDQIIFSMDVHTIKEGQQE